MISASKTARLLAVSYPVTGDDAPLLGGAQRLEAAGFRLQWPTNLGMEHGHLAGTDPERRAELAAAMGSDADVVWVARAGYGQARLLRDVDRPVTLPPPLVGHSDATALLHLWAGWGATAVHGPNVWGLADVEQKAFDATLAALEGRGTLGWKLDRLCGPAGPVTGTLCGGNLTTLLMATAAGHIRLPDRAVVVLEDAFETAYAVDRMLCVLRDSGALDRAAALVLGHFDLVEPTSRQPSLPLERIATDLFAGRLPVFTGAPVGHRPDSAPFVVGAKVTIEDGVCNHLSP